MSRGKRVAITIKEPKTPKEKKKKCERKRLGFTNKLALLIMLFLALTAYGGYRLAVMSIATGYVGALACYTVAIAPVDTAAGIVLGKIVDKSKAENVGGNGDGINYYKATHSSTTVEYNKNSPPI